jgi:hypothetical protein
MYAFWTIGGGGQCYDFRKIIWVVFVVTPGIRTRTVAKECSSTTTYKGGGIFVGSPLCNIKT